jgi:hypothetical protein
VPTVIVALVFEPLVIPLNATALAVAAEVAVVAEVAVAALPVMLAAIGLENVFVPAIV